jgi:hypothetical protein
LGILLTSHSLRESRSASSTRWSSDSTSQRLGIPLPEIDASHPHRSLVGVVEPEQQLHEGALARSVLADQRHQLAMADGQTQSRHRGLGPARIGEGDVVEFDPVYRSGGDDLRLRRPRHQRFDGQEREIVLEEGGVLIHRHEGAGDLAQRSRDGGESADHEHNATGIDGAGHPPNRHEDVGQRQGGAGHQSGEHRHPRGRPVHLLPLAEQALGQVAVPTQQIVGQRVGPDFLGGAGLNQQIAEVFAFALLRRLLVEEFVHP